MRNISPYRLEKTSSREELRTKPLVKFIIPRNHGPLMSGKKKGDGGEGSGGDGGDEGKDERKRKRKTKKEEPMMFEPVF